MGHQETEGSTQPGEVDERTGDSALPKARTALSGLAFGGFQAVLTAEDLDRGRTDGRKY